MSFYLKKNMSQKHVCPCKVAQNPCHKQLIHPARMTCISWTSHWHTVCGTRRWPRHKLPLWPSIYLYCSYSIIYIYICIIYIYIIRLDIFHIFSFYIHIYIIYIYIDFFHPTCWQIRNPLQISNGDFLRDIARIASRFTAWKIGPADVWPSRHPRNFHSRPRSHLAGSAGSPGSPGSPDSMEMEVICFTTWGRPRNCDLEVLHCVTVCHFGMSQTHEYSMCRTLAVSNRIVVHNYVYIYNICILRPCILRPF